MREDGVDAVLDAAAMFKPQDADGLLTQASVRWSICESFCLERPASVWDKRHSRYPGQGCHFKSVRRPGALGALWVEDDPRV